MKFFSLYRVELRRLLLTKQVWLVSALCLCTPLLGYFVYKPVLIESLSGLYIGNPVLAATAAGAVLWAFIAVSDANRQRRSQTDILVNVSAPPVAHSAAKVSALMTVCTAAALLCILVYVPFTMRKLDYLFDAEFYLFNYLVFMLPTWWISILFAEGFYQITQRADLSAMMYTVLAYISYSRFAEKNYFLHWLNPVVATYSDGFPDIWFLRLGLYTRLVWLCIAAGVWTFSLICLRQYQKGLAGSFIKGLKKIYLPAAALALIVIAVNLWKNQTFIGNGPDEYIGEDDFSNGTEFMTNVSYSIKVNPLLGTLSGKAEFRLTTPKQGESVLRLNAGYKITNITYGGEPVAFNTVREDIDGQYDTYFKLPQKYAETLVIEYQGFPTVAKFIIPSVYNVIGENFIYLEHTACVPWLADYGCISYGVITLEATIPDRLTPFIEFEPLTDFVDNGDGTRTYRTQLEKSYIYSFVAGTYITDSFSSNDYNFRFLYGDIYRTAVEEYNVRQSICDVFDYCTKHYGKPPYMEGDYFTLFQLSSMKMGGFARRGMSTWFEDVISPSTLSDSYRGASAEEVFIHEMIHQWWGGVGMLCEAEELWSSEGLTVYSTYRLVKEKYGELYARQYYVDEWLNAVARQNRNFYNRHPEYLEMLPEQYCAKLRNSNRSINWYQRMPLMILKAEELVGGEEKMDEILSRMYVDYIDSGRQKAVTYEDFLNYCGLTQEDLRLD